MKSKFVSIPALIILIATGAILLNRSTCNNEAMARTLTSVFHSNNALAEDTLTKVALEGSGYSVMMPAGYYMSRVPYEGYVPKANDGDLNYYFFPVIPDTVCRTRLMIGFENTPLPKTGYARGSEFRIDGTILENTVSFLDHATCRHPYRMRSASVPNGPGKFLNIIIEAGSDSTMNALFTTAQSLQVVQ